VKTTSAALRNHLDQIVTTLATIWRITRQDGVEFFFTDHDVDIVFETNTYIASSGYTRSAVQNDSSMSVDNLDVVGVFDDDSITESDMEAGLFDFAVIRISLVNWADLTQGEMKIRKGNFGEITTTIQGTFRTELRGLTQPLVQNILEVYSPECRVDLGDPKCAIPILPPVLQRSTAVTVGQFFRVATTSNEFSVNQAIVNRSFEQDTTGNDVSSITGWTILNGGWDIHDSTNLGLSPDDGLLYLEGGTSDGEIFQDIPITNLLPDVTVVESGLLQVDFIMRRANSAQDDEGRVILEYRDINGNVLSTPFDTGFETITPEDVWVTRSLAANVAPSNTRIIRIRLLHQIIFGAQGNSAFDNSSLKLTVTGSVDTTTQAQYENRVYEVTTAGTTAASQPVYDTIIGNTTTDGTAVLTTLDAFMRNAEISQVTDLRNIEIVVAEARAVDDWFNGGGLTFETGLSTGQTAEMKDWAQANSQLLLFLPAEFALQVGQKIRLYAGCDKRLQTCIDKFDNVLNFRGEPFVPGSDVLVRYPDAR